MRGENLSMDERNVLRGETSPHAWRKRTYTAKQYEVVRNISTCVEKTGMFGIHFIGMRKHLHMRGENYRILTVDY